MQRIYTDRGVAWIGWVQLGLRAQNANLSWRLMTSAFAQSGRDLLKVRIQRGWEGFKSVAI